jgi:hypothetical protein
MLDEPGVASATEGSSSVTINDATTILLSRSITAPAAGYVLVIASGQAQVGHSNGTTSSIDFGVSDVSTTLPVNQDLAWMLSAAAGTGTYTAPVTVHGLFSVTSGSHTFYFLGNKTSTTGNSYMLDTQLTLLYIPTFYGTVEPTLAGGTDVPDGEAPVRTISAAEVTAERSASEEANDARVEHELAAMRDRIAALEEELRNRQ